MLGEPLAAPADSHNIRVGDGVATMTDGPFAESKERFVGFLLIDVTNEARAIEIAASWPDARYAASEVRLVNGSTLTDLELNPN